MKTLIIESIQVAGLNMGNKVLTVFNNPDQDDRISRKYFDLSTLCGRNIRISFQYTEGDRINHSFHNMRLPNGITEFEVKDLIISEIQKSL